MDDVGRGAAERCAVKVAVGITTFARPKFLDKCLRSTESALRPLRAPLAVCNDGSGERWGAEYRRAYRRAPEAYIIESEQNLGVACAKNTLLRWMLDETDADWLFLLEDDILLMAPEAVTEYVRIADEMGFHHLSFAHHGPANASGPVAAIGEVEFYPHSIGAWCLYSRSSLEQVGLFDENFHNAWEHVEHELRMIEAGFMPLSGAHRFPDISGSSRWVAEMPNAIERSSIRPRDDWNSSIVDGLAYWHDAKPNTFAIMFGAGTPLEGYARGILGDHY